MKDTRGSQRYLLWLALGTTVMAGAMAVLLVLLGVSLLVRILF